MTGLGSRGGDTETLDEARELQETFKAAWTERINLGIARALRDRGEFHADDLYGLCIPAEHANLIGVSIAAFVRRDLMTETGRRKGSSPASKGRKSGVFTVTERGRGVVGMGAGLPLSGSHPGGPGRDANREGTADHVPPHPRQAGPHCVGEPSGARSSSVAVPGSLRLPRGRSPQERVRSEIALLEACDEAVAAGDAEWLGKPYRRTFGAVAA